MTTINASTNPLSQSFQNGNADGAEAPTAAVSASLPPASDKGAGAAVVVTLSAAPPPASPRRNLSTPLDLADALAKSLSERQEKEEAADSISLFVHAKKNMISDRKDTAQHRLVEARQQLEILRRFGGDPESVARQASQIAREIRAAAMEYAAAMKAQGVGIGTGSASALTAVTVEAAAKGAATAASTAVDIEA